MELCMVREANGCFQWRLSGIAFFASMSTSLGSVEQQGLGEDRVLIGKFDEVYMDLNLEDCSEVRWRRWPLWRAYDVLAKESTYPDVRSCFV
jgi:hypothetical protein